MSDLTCENQKCRATFEPQWRGQVYCCTSCRMAERNWRKAQGEKILNAAIAGEDVTDLIDTVVKSRK